MKTRSKICGNCFYYNLVLDPNNIGKGQAFCMLKSPTIFPIQNPKQPGNVQLIPIRPPVAESDWCGEWAPLEKSLDAS